MRIAQFCVRYPPAMGGVETHVKEISERFVRRGHEVTVRTTDLDTEFPFARLGAVDDPPWVVRRRARNPFPFHYVVAPGMVRDIRLEADIVHAHSYGYFQTNMAPFIAGLRDARLVVTPHYHPPWTMIGGEGRMRARRVFDRAVAPFLLSRADAIVNVSREERDLMEDIVPVGVRRAVIPNGIDMARFTPVPDGRAFREEHGIEGRMVLYTGRLAKNKRLEHVIEVLPALTREHDDVVFVAVGADNGMRAPWERLARRKGVADRVRFIDFVPYEVLVDAYGAADVFVLPSDYEAFGIVLLEAMAARTPVVASRVGGVPDVVEDGVTGLLYPYGDLDALGTALGGLLGDAGERARMGERGRERVERLFTWDSVVDRLLALYAGLLGDR